MSTYRVKAGHDQDLVSLVVLDPQPDPGPIIQITRRTFSADGSVYDEGRFIEIHFSALDDANAYQALMTLFGLNASTAFADVTVYVRDEVFNWVRMNGVAIRPVPGSEMFWGDTQSRPLNVSILVKNLTTASDRDVIISDDVEVSESTTVSVP